MAAYNREKYISESIDSICSQTYGDWELIISDDGSIDKTCNIVNEYIKKDNRIKLLRSPQNKGAAAARNAALNIAQGRYIAYLDSDDLWVNDKLEKQLKFMNEHKCGMCYTSYEIINSDGEYRKTIYVPPQINYTDFLKAPLTCSHSVMFDTNLVDKKLLIMPNVVPEDAATWLNILKNGVVALGMNDVLAKYRRHENSVSHNKLNAILNTWNLYRKVENLSFPYSIKCFISYIFNALKKYIWFNLR